MLVHEQGRPWSGAPAGEQPIDISLLISELTTLNKGQLGSPLWCYPVFSSCGVFLYGMIETSFFSRSVHPAEGGGRAGCVGGSGRIPPSGLFGSGQRYMVFVSVSGENLRLFLWSPWHPHEGGGYPRPIFGWLPAGPPPQVLKSNLDRTSLVFI